MRKALNVQIWIILIALLALEGCLEPPEYSNVPRITLEGLVYKKVYVPVVSDSLANLIFTLGVQDGDGDIGLVDGDVSGLFSDFFYIAYYDSARVYFEDFIFTDSVAVFVGTADLTTKQQDSIQSKTGADLGLDFIARPNRVGDSLRFYFRKTVQEEKTEKGYFTVTFDDPQATPPFYLIVDAVTQKDDIYSLEPLPAFNCIDYEYDEEDDAYYYVKRNDKSSNLIIRYFKKREGVYLETTLPALNSNNDCPELTTAKRIPIFDYEKLGKTLRGNFTYTENSRGLNDFLASDTFKIELYIYDRALNKSNVVMTSDLVLSDIAK